MSASIIKRGDWSEGFIFRIAFIFILLLTIPLSAGYYRHLFTADWLKYNDVFKVVNYVPQFFSPFNWGIASFTGWGIALLISVAGALVWTRLVAGKEKSQQELYYWLRVVVRYRLALALLSYGAIKIFPVQLPGPTISDLHTAYGDFLPWKLYYLSTGVASAYYEQSLGAIEFLSGVLLLFRRTTVIGAGIATSLLVNIVLANFAYQLGDHLYSVYLLLLAVFLLTYDVPRLYNLLVKERAAKADTFEPAFRFRFKPVFQIIVLLFTVFFSSITFAAYKKVALVKADSAVLKDAAGVYDVELFSVNGKPVPYSATDSLRWNNVVFEPWNVLSIQRNIDAPLNLESPGLLEESAGLRDYESKGNLGRFFYSYSLQNNNIRLINKNKPSDRLNFTVSRPEKGLILLKGLINKGDSVVVALRKQEKEYLLEKGRRKKVTVY